MTSKSILELQTLVACQVLIAFIIKLIAQGMSALIWMHIASAMVNA